MTLRTATFLSCLIVLGPASAFASGYNLAWNDCGSLGVSNRTFACNQNTGRSSMLLSFVTSGEIDSVQAVEARIDAQFASASLPRWWDLVNPGSCRPGDLQMVAALPALTSGECIDPWVGRAIGGVAYQTAASTGGLIPPNAARIYAVAAVPPENSVPIESEIEYFALRLDLSNGSTVGDGSCSGCSTPGCLQVRSLDLYTPGRPLGVPIRNPAVRSILFWQSGGGLVCQVPVQNRTWGAIKSLYR